MDKRSLWTLKQRILKTLFQENGLKIENKYQKDITTVNLRNSAQNDTF